MNRAEHLAALPTHVDLLVIGGGITGAGIALEAARRGVKVLLVEARDFAWGTSSRSSKLVHGGLRYMKEGKPHLTYESVRERDQLMREVPGLVDPIGFVMAHHTGRKPGRGAMRVGLALYDLFAGRRSSGWANANDLHLLAPGLQSNGLTGASLYLDATTDDARLVMRVLDEAVACSATVINYLSAQALLRDEKGQVNGAELVDAESGTSVIVHANCVIAATGVWADQLRSQLGEAPKLRPLRGSHLLLPAWRLPLARAVAFLHPTDQRPVFAYPWQGCTLVGTTDLDHADLAAEPAISEIELDYLLKALNGYFPGLSATASDVISTWAGVRPVIDSGKGLTPSQESRDHLVLNEHGLISVTGGKLTTFRRIAQDTLKHAASRLPNLRAASDDSIIPRAPAPPALQRLPIHLHARLCGCYGARLGALLDATNDDELALIPGTAMLQAELRWAARHEQVMHLDDLLLRRTRLGLTLRDGAATLLPTLQTMLTEELGWNNDRWQQELSDYHALIKRCYSLPMESRR
jgi:glycerol-3-phosphate dehydrogenase